MPLRSCTGAGLDGHPALPTIAELPSRAKAHRTSPGPAAASHASGLRPGLVRCSAAAAMRTPHSPSAARRGRGGRAAHPDAGAHPHGVFGCRPQRPPPAHAPTHAPSPSHSHEHAGGQKYVRKRRGSASYVPAHSSAGCAACSTAIQGYGALPIQFGL